jgi:hypothetical protein
MNRDELHELVMLLKDALACGELKIAEGSGVRESLAAVRLNADGKVDPNTVNGHVRAVALAAAAARSTREVRKVPLRDIQSQYFEILDQFFGQPFSEMKTYGVSPAQIADNIASQDGIRAGF